MTTSKLSFIELTESIQINDVVTFQINTDVIIQSIQSLNQNFLIVKECLIKVQELQNEFSKEKSQKDNFTNIFTSL